MNLLAYLERHNCEHTSSASEVRVNCTRCGDYKHHAYVSLRTGSWMCHRCGEKGGVYNLVAMLEGEENYANIKKILQSVKAPAHNHSDLNISFFLEQLTVRPKEDANATETHRKIPWPKYRTKDVDTGVKAYSYLRARGFSRADIQYYRLRCSACEKYVVVPFFEEGDLVYYQIREINGDQKLNPENGVALGKSCYLFNHDGAAQYEEVIVVEGWADAITVGRNAVAIQGKVLSKIQAKKLAALEAKRYIIFLDADDDTTKQQADSAQLLSVYTQAPVFIVDAYGATKKDPNDLGRAECNRIISENLIRYGATSKLTMALASLTFF